jgi:hypothetical protein
MRITDYLDRIASDLESKGLFKEAYDIDILANTLDLMTQHAKVTERERMEELNYAGQYISATRPNLAMQSFLDYWGPEYGPTIYDLAKRKASGDTNPGLFQNWQTVVGKARQSKSVRRQLTPEQTSQDPFMSQAEREKLRRPVQQKDDVFTRSE